MKTLLLMRHAKSNWDAKVDSDYERPLNKRGREAATKVGRLLDQMNLRPDIVLCSTAVRTHQTWELLSEASRLYMDTRFLHELYHCSSDELVPILQEIPDEASRALVIGHNPGLSDFLAEAANYREKFPTAALACLTCNVASWSDIQPQQPMHLQNLWRPRELS